MRLFIDAEFNSASNQLISLALVAEDNSHSFYEVVATRDSIKDLDPWVSNNVFPILNKAPIPIEQFRVALDKFLRIFPEVEIVGDHPNDLYLFMEHITEARLSKEWVDFDIKFSLYKDLSAKKSKIPHNALADAEALRESFADVPGYSR